MYKNVLKLALVALFTVGSITTPCKATYGMDAETIMIAGGAALLIAAFPTTAGVGVGYCVGKVLSEKITSELGKKGLKIGFSVVGGMVAFPLGIALVKRTILR